MSKYTILYARLSQEDGKEGMSNSIENQRLILEKYAEDNGFDNCKFIYDDGRSGTSFKRPGWNEVMKLVESDQAETLIVEDSSRLGRNYIEVGLLTEIKLPALNVRYIAINDCADSKYGLDDFAPFRNMFHELYAKDCSKKQRQVRRTIAERGGRVATRAAYGYKKKESNPKEIEIDEEVAFVVREIFNLCIQGRGPTQIAKEISKRYYLKPSNYYFEQTGVVITGFNAEKPFEWSTETIKRILDNEIYIGHTVSLKTTTRSFKDKTTVYNKEEDWIITKDTHEAIIDQDTWDIAQEVRKSKKRTRKNMDEPNIFAGVTFCADCGGYLVVHRAKTIDPSKNSLACSVYKNKGKDACHATHHILERHLKTVVLDDLKRVTHYARMHEKDFLNLIYAKSEKETHKAIKVLTNKIAVHNKRYAELTALFKRLYEDNISNKINDEMFKKLSEDYMSEQEVIKSELPEMEGNLERIKNTLVNAEKFLDKVSKYTDITELTPELLRHFIERIEVGARPKYSRTAKQDIKIYYRDIGYLEDYIDASSQSLRENEQQEKLAS